MTADAGAEPVDREPADRGLFGPGSPTWRIMGEPVIWVAGLRALYLQALHPRVMRGTWQNTSFAKPGEAWGRFVRTTEFVSVRTYGTTAQVERAGRRLRKIHAMLTGTDPGGSRFRLDEPCSPLTDVGATAALRMAHQSTTRIPRQLIYLSAARAAHRRRRERQRHAAA